MPYKMEWERNGFYFKFSGDITYHEICEASYEILNYHDFDMFEYFIVDLTDVVQFMVEGDELDIMAETGSINAAYREKMKSAFVVTNDQLRSAVKLHISNVRKKGSKWEIKIFSKLSEARKWL